MSDSAAVPTPPSEHVSSASLRDRSPIITGVSALSSPSASSMQLGDGDLAAAAAGPRATAAPRDAVEALSDAEDGHAAVTRTQEPRRRLSEMRGASQATTASEPYSVHITAADYADRRRLLNHITYLSTQLQRAQLQVEDLTRTVCVVRGVCGGGADGAGADAVRAAVSGDATSAAVLAARDEAEVHAALQAALAVFDPVIAQTQIYRLDDALAQLGLLREAELAQLHASASALDEHRTLATRLSEEVAQLRSRSTALQQQKDKAEAQLTAATLELQRLRHEERQLNQRVAGLQELAQDGTWLSNVRVVGSKQSGGNAAAAAAQLAEEEQRARQALLQEMFWDPLLIAFDAGLTWMADSATLRGAVGRSSSQVTPSAELNVMAEAGGAAALEEGERLSLLRAGIVAEAPAPPSDADLLLLRRQQEEVAELRGRVQLLQDRNRLSQLENERLQHLYENEMRRSERMAQDHVAQLQQAYDEVVKDRQLIMSKLRDEVEEQLRVAFEDGRAYEKRATGRSGSRSRPTKKVLRSS